MEPLGFCGIMKFGTHIIHRNLKHFLCIACILVLSYALTPIPSLAHIISLLYNFASHGKTPPTPPAATLPYPLLIAILLLPILLRLFTQPLLTFSVCKAVLSHKTLAFKSSLKAVPQSALNLALTTLCVTGVQIGVFATMVNLMILVAAGLSAAGIDPTILMAIWSVVTMAGVLYLGIAWSLADTVAILEEKRGWEAMKRSRYLVNGSKGLVCSLFVVFGVCMMFLPILVSHEASAMWRWSCVLLSLGLQAMIALVNMVSMVVLYLSCKSRFKEPLDNLIALSPQFSPPQTSAKYMDLPSSRFDTA